MKAGGFVNGIRLLREAKKNGMQTMIGCMVETTLGLELAYIVAQITDYADLDSFMLLKNENYQILKEQNGFISY